MLTSAMSPEAVTAAVERIRDGRGAARLRRPRALHERPLPRRDRRGRRRPPGRRRGALPLGVGPRLPPRLPEAGRRAGASGLSADHRSDGHGDAAGGGRHRDGAPAPRPGDAADGLRPPQPHVRRRPGGRRPRQAARARLPAARARRASGRRLLRPPAHVRGGGRCAVSRRAACIAVSRRARQRPAIRHPDGLPRRGARCRVRDDRLRHGHRQGRRPLGRPLGAPALAGGVLPAGRPRRARRAAGALHAPLCTSRQGPHRPFHQPRAVGPDRPDRRARGCRGAGRRPGRLPGARARPGHRRAPCRAGRARAGRCARALPGARRLGRRPGRRRQALEATPGRGGHRGPPRRAAPVGPARGDRRLRDERRLPPGRAPRVLLGRTVERGARSVLRRVRSGCRAPARRRGARADARGRRRRAVGGAARRRRDRGTRRSHAHRPDSAWLARAGARLGRSRPARLVRRPHSALVRRGAPGRRLADRLRRARAHRRPVPAGAQAGRSPGRHRPGRRAARPGQGARPARCRGGDPVPRPRAGRGRGSRSCGPWPPRRSEPSAASAPRRHFALRCPITTRASPPPCALR